MKTKKKPNKATVKAMKEATSGKLKKHKSTKELFDSLSDAKLKYEIKEYERKQAEKHLYITIAVWLLAAGLFAAGLLS